MQFQKHIRAFWLKREDESDKISTAAVTRINFANIPSSEIIQMDGDRVQIVLSVDDAKDSLRSFIQNAKQIAHKLYEKYVENGATFEINISGKMRDELTETIGDLEALSSDEAIGLNELYTVFEESVREMMSLQSTAFERFKKVKDFESVKAILSNRESTACEHEQMWIGTTPC